MKIGRGRLGSEMVSLNEKEEGREVDILHS